MTYSREDAAFLASVKIDAEETLDEKMKRWRYGRLTQAIQRDEDEIQYWLYLAMKVHRGFWSIAWWMVRQEISNRWADLKAHVEWNLDGRPDLGDYGD